MATASCTADDGGPEGELLSWGSNQYGQLGRLSGDDVAVPVRCDALRLGPLRAGDVKALYAGGGHSALLLGDGRLFLWGWGEHGQLGRPPAHDSDGALAPLPLLVREAALGHTHTLLLVDVGGGDGGGERGGGGGGGGGGAARQRMFACGSNKFGECGVRGGAAEVRAPAAVDALEAGEQPCRALAAGVRHSAAVSAQGRLVTWGCSRHGQCLDGGARWAPGGGGELEACACGHGHTAARDAAGSVWVLGAGKHGQHGDGGGSGGAGDVVPQAVLFRLDGGEAPARCVLLDSGWSHCAALLEGGGALTWGRNNFGQVGQGSFTPRAAAGAARVPSGAAPLLGVHCSPEGCVALGTDGAVWSCGWNEHGNLGTGDTESRHTLVPVEGLGALPAGTTNSVRFVAAGGAHVLVFRCGPPGRV